MNSASLSFSSCELPPKVNNGEGGPQQHPVQHVEEKSDAQLKALQDAGNSKHTNVISITMALAKVLVGISLVPSFCVGYCIGAYRGHRTVTPNRQQLG
jgi:hypothetical protein